MKLLDKFILYGTYDGFSRSTLGDDNLYLVLENGEKVEIPRRFVKNASDFVEKDKLKLKNIISRMGVLNDETRKEWIDTILYEFGERFGTLKYRDGYEQGKVEGMVEREKVTIPKHVADWIEYTKFEDYHLLGAMDSIAISGRKNLDEWFRGDDDNMELFARAWLDGYTVEKEKKYRVKVRGVAGNSRYLKCVGNAQNWIIGNNEEYVSIKSKHTRKELEEAGFGWVFDCEGIELEEVD